MNGIIEHRTLSPLCFKTRPQKAQKSEPTQVPTLQVNKGSEADF